MGTPTQPTDPAARANAFRWLPLALVLLTILFVGYVRWRIADTPLERDEGEYAYGGQLIRHGEAPYKNLYNIKLPGTYAAYAAIMTLFGETPVGIHLGLLLVNAASIILIYLIGKKLSGPTAGVLAAVFFAFLTLDPSFLGFAAQATHFVVLAALVGFYFLLRALDTEHQADVFLSGLAMGFCFICKQPGLFFGALAFAFIIWLSRVRNKPGLRVTYAIGWLVPYALTCFFVWIGGCWGTFWTWTTKYAGSHSEPASAVIPTIKLNWNQSPPWIQFIAFCSVMAVVYLAFNRRTQLQKRALLIGTLLCGIIAVVPGFSFYRHYFIMITPGAALIVAVALVEITRPGDAESPRRFLRFLPVLIGVLWSIFVVTSLKYYMFVDAPDVIAGMRYVGNPVLQSRVIGSYLADHCPAGARIAVLESEPEIFFYARRKSATGYIYAYDITGLGSSAYRPEMEKQCKREIIQANPEYVVFVLCPFAWKIKDEAGMAFADWCWRFPKTNYTRVAVADNLSPSLRDTTFMFDAAAATYTPRSPTYIEVYHRNSTQAEPRRGS